VVITEGAVALRVWIGQGLCTPDTLSAAVVAADVGAN
jgi:hypothetical protein